jgi:hypothetical protein
VRGGVVDEARCRSATAGLETAARLWLETNKPALDAINPMWYKKVKRDLERSDWKDRHPCVIALATALWLFNILATLGVAAGVGVDFLKVHRIPEQFDMATTLFLLATIRDAFKATTGGGRG